MKVHYIEIVTSDVESVCSSYEASSGVRFGPPDAALGGAKTAKMEDGSMLGVRAPMNDSEQPVVRPYWRVSDLGAALEAAVQAGAEVALPPLEIPEKGMIAIYFLGGVQHALWEL